MKNLLINVATFLNYILFLAIIAVYDKFEGTTIVILMMITIAFATLGMLGIDNARHWKYNRRSIALIIISSVLYVSLFPLCIAYFYLGYTYTIIRVAIIAIVLYGVLFILANVKHIGKLYD